MKRLALLALAATGAIAAQAQPYGYGRPAYAAAPAPVVAGQAPTFVDRARVTGVEPQYEVVQVPRQECSTQYVQDAPQPVAGGTPGVAGAVIGGVAGGILGHQVGRGTGRDVATAAGAIVGALAGNSIQNANAQPQGYVQAPPREVQQCHTVMEQQQRAAGYRVTYEYRGNMYTTVMHEQPGHSLPVRVSVTPLEER